MDFIYFLGRFHVLALHIPIGVIVAVALLEILSRYWERCRSLRAAAPYLWGVAAVSAILTVVLGFMHYTEGGFDGPSVRWHMILGTSVALISIAAWALSVFADRIFLKTVVPLSVALVVLISLTGHFGGNMTHGETYLWEYAPGPLRALHGMEEPRARVTDLESADPYLDLIKPITDARCLSCHNDDRRQGELSMVDYDTLMSGGEFIPAIVPFAPDASPLIQRIKLPEGHEDFMPAEGKTPLTVAETELLEWWVFEGAPAGATFGELGLELDDYMETVIRYELGLTGEEE